MKRYFKCVGYKQDKEHYFTVGKIYEVNDNSITSDPIPEKGFKWGFNYNTGDIDVIKFLSHWYKFEEVKKRPISDFVEKNIAVFFNDLEQERRFLKLCEDNGLRWCSGKRATEYEPTYAGFGKGGSSVVFGFAGKNGISFCKASYHARNGYDLVNASEFLGGGNSIQKSYKVVIDCIDGKTTIAEFYVNGEVVKSVKAKLSPEDKFNFQIGARTAFERLFEKKKDHDGCDGCAHLEKEEAYCKTINCRGAFPPSQNKGKPDMYKRK